METTSNGTSCLFCKIIKKEIPADIIHEDDFSLAMLDINPVNIGHTLLMPKEHFENIFDLPDELLKKLSVNTKRLAQAIKKSLSADGISVNSNNGRVGQLVFHSHTHIIPRFENDGFKHWKGKRAYNDGEARQVTEKIKKEL